MPKHQIHCTDIKCKQARTSVRVTGHKMHSKITWQWMSWSVTQYESCYELHFDCAFQNASQYSCHNGRYLLLDVQWEGSALVSNNVFLKWYSGACKIFRPVTVFVLLNFTTIIAGFTDEVLKACNKKSSLCQRSYIVPILENTAKAVLMPVQKSHAEGYVGISSRYAWKCIIKTFFHNYGRYKLVNTHQKYAKEHFGKLVKSYLS